MRNMDQHPNNPRLDVTVVVPRELWRRVKYQAWRRQTTAKNLLIAALEKALSRWEAEQDDDIERCWR